MATTTPNYGWTVPTSGDLVKDGATAIETLGDAIDASMNTALGTKKAGLVLLNTTSFSGVASTSLTADTFTSTYINYKIVINAAYSSGVAFRIRLRAAGSDNTNNTYIIQNVGGNNTTISGGRTTSTSWEFQQFATNNINGEINIFNPKATELTRMTYQFSGANGTDEYALFGNGYFNATTSFDSATLFPSSGTMTGSYSIYAYNI